MAKKGKGRQKQGPPVTFRPGPELEQLVTGLATARGLRPNEVFKNLAALAVAGLDVRYFDLMSQMAARMTGANAFVRAALHIHTALLGAVRTEGRVRPEPERSLFVIGMVRDYVSNTGGTLPTEVVQVLLVQLGLAGNAPPSDRTESEDAGFRSTEFGREKEVLKVPIILE